MSAHEKLAGMFPSRNLGESVAREVLSEDREDALRRAADWLRKRYGITNRAAGDLLRLADQEAQGHSELWPEENR